MSSPKRKKKMSPRTKGKKGKRAAEVAEEAAPAIGSPDMLRQQSQTNASVQASSMEAEFQARAAQDSAAENQVAQSSTSIYMGKKRYLKSADIEPMFERLQHEKRTATDFPVTAKELDRLVKKITSAMTYSNPQHVKDSGSKPWDSFAKGHFDAYALTHEARRLIKHSRVSFEQGLQDPAMPSYTPREMYDTWTELIEDIILKLRVYKTYAQKPLKNVSLDIMCDAPAHDIETIMENRGRNGGKAIMQAVGSALGVQAKDQLHPDLAEKVDVLHTMKAKKGAQMEAAKAAKQPPKRMKQPKLKEERYLLPPKTEDDSDSEDEEDLNVSGGRRLPAKNSKEQVGDDGGRVIERKLHSSVKRRLEIAHDDAPKAKKARKSRAKTTTETNVKKSRKPRASKTTAKKQANTATIEEPTPSQAADSPADNEENNYAMDDDHLNSRQIASSRSSERASTGSTTGFGTNTYSGIDDSTLESLLASTRPTISRPEQGEYLSTF